MPEMWIPRLCPADGSKLRKLKTNRTLHIGGMSPINDYGMYFQNPQSEVTNVFGFYVCPVCGLMQTYEIDIKGEKKNE